LCACSHGISRKEQRMRTCSVRAVVNVRERKHAGVRLTQLTQHATHESKIKYTLLYAKGHSAQPDMFWRTHYTESDPKSMRVMPLCLRGV
jgi:hypothetical protein